MDSTTPSALIVALLAAASLVVLGEVRDSTLIVGIGVISLFATFLAALTTLDRT